MDFCGSGRPGDFTEAQVFATVIITCFLQLHGRIANGFRGQA
jgi:hypothetical protein